jgi:hypothetical protein
MEKRNSRNSSTRRLHQPVFPSFYFLFSIVFLLSGCGAPGEPTPPSPPVPAAITDLSARQAGDGVQLTFTMPAKTIRGERLTEPPSLEILRGALSANSSPDLKSFRLVYTIPGSLVNNYRAEDHVQFIDPVAPEEIRAHPGSTLAYRVRTRASQKKASPDSNTVLVKVFPVPQRIASVQTTVAETSIELNWPAPNQTSASEALAAISEYRVYRGELDPSSADAASKDLSQAKWKSALTLIAPATTNTYRDAAFEFGKTYLYIVRSVILVEGQSLESSDSLPAVVTPHDTFPPSVPRDVVAAVVAGNSSSTPEVDLSWSINVETDLAGYRVYRSEQQTAKGQLLTSELLLSPSYRDTSVQPGHRYWYCVTAVDRVGNESEPSAPVAADVTQLSS